MAINNPWLNFRLSVFCPAALVLRLVLLRESAVVYPQARRSASRGPGSVAGASDDTLETWNDPYLGRW